MQCGAFQEYVQQFLDGDLPVPPADFEAHRAACRDCRETYAAAVELARGLRLAAWPAPPPGLAPLITTRLLADHAHRRSLRRAWATAAVAASLLLATALTFLALKNPPHSSTSPVAATTPPIELQTAAVLSVDGNLSNAGSALTSFVEVTARETVKQGQLLLPEKVAAPKLADLDALQQSFEPPAQSLLQAGQNVSASLEPVASSARRAFVTFVQDLSPMGEQQ